LSRKLAFPAIAGAAMRVLPLLALLMSTNAPSHGTAAAPAPVAVPTPAACAAAERRAFDFWIGEWEVIGPKGNIVGHSRIEAILGGCAIAEHWQSATGNGANDGNSYNIYNADLKRWEQFWVDASGSRLLLAGGLVEGSMVLEGRQDLPAADGVHARDRITWTPNADGSVRQRWENSKDEGKTWTVAFDGLYRRRPATGR
jgi:hypothetical protein